MRCARKPVLGAPTRILHLIVGMYQGQQSERWGGEQAGWLLFLILSCFSRRQLESLSRA